MNSPVEIPFKSFIEIKRNSEIPIYLQFANQLAKAIQLGYIPSGTKLPGSRKLSNLFQLHRNTIVASLQELEMQGWIQVVPNKGCFILDQTIEKLDQITLSNQYNIKSYPNKTGFLFDSSILLDNPYETPSQKLYLTDGTIDYRLAELKIPAKLYSTVLKRKTSIQKIKQSTNDYFQKNLANYLNLTRGLNITKENILITRTSEIALFIMAQIVLKNNDYIAVTDFSYYKSNMIFQTQNVKIKQIKTDKFGLDTNHLKKMCEQFPIRLVYITPHHHYPTTVTLSSRRRVDLLKLSNEFGFIILEDDYDYDFHYHNHPILPLACTDQSGMVIYTGKFGNYLAPGYSIGFLIAPSNFVREAKKHLSILDQQIDPFIEQVLGEMIGEGEIHRILKKLRKEYKDRLDFFCKEAKQELGSKIEFKKPNGGLAVWINFKIATNLINLKKKCEKDGLFIPQTILYQNSKTTSIRVGFAHLNLQEISYVINILKKNLE